MEAADQEQNLMRYHSAPGSLLCSLMPLSSAQQQQQLDMSQMLLAGRMGQAHESPKMHHMFHSYDEQHQQQFEGKGKDSMAGFDTGSILQGLEIAKSSNMSTPPHHMVNVTAYEECSLLKQNSSPADLLSKLVEGLSSREHQSMSMRDHTQNLSINMGISPININSPEMVVPLLMPLSRSGSGDGMPTVSRGNVEQIGPDNPSLWFDSRKRRRDSSEEQYGEDMTGYCEDQEQMIASRGCGDCAVEYSALGLARHFPPGMSRELQDAVPCKLRARRGCATHPRSVAERVRRTKISEGIKRLHDLVPNMDKQTNTADMLNHAMEYMKQLKEQIEQLKEEQRRCKEKCQGLCTREDNQH